MVGSFFPHLEIYNGTALLEVDHGVSDYRSHHGDDACLRLERTEGHMLLERWLRRGCISLVWRFTELRACHLAKDLGRCLGFGARVSWWFWLRVDQGCPNASDARVKLLPPLALETVFGSRGTGVLTIRDGISYPLYVSLDQVLG